MTIIVKLILAYGLLVACLSVVAVLIVNITRKRHGLTESEISRAVEDRKKQAEEREIASTISFILDVFGSEEVSDSGRNVYLRRLADKVAIEVAGAIVFEAKLIPEWTFAFERKVIEPDFEGRGFAIKNKSDSVTLAAQYEIEAYIPGVWEQHLNTLRSLAADRQRAIEVESAGLAREKERLEIEEQRKRFGI